MKFHRLLSLAGIAAFAAMLSGQAQALDYGADGICPSTFGHASAGGGGTGNATTCNLVITFNADGSITTTAPAGAQTSYESIEDALIGVVNNSSTTITSFSLTQIGSDIFGFEGDGIDVYSLCGGTDGSGATLGQWTGATACNITPAAGNPDTTGYGGLKGYFTGINAAGDSGVVNFAGGVASGTTSFFSLELPASLNLKANNPVPEPASLGLLAAGLAGLAALRRRKA